MWNTSFSNKTQLKIFFFTGSDLVQCIFIALDRVRSPLFTWTVESELSTGEERRQEQEKNAGETDKTYFS